MRDPRRWLLVALASLAALSLHSLLRGEVVKSSHASCLLHPDCLKTERCYVVPATDGFAAFGTCVDPCTDDLQCRNGERCVEVGVAVQGYLAPPASKAVGASRERVCIRAKDCP